MTQDGRSAAAPSPDATEEMAAVEESPAPSLPPVQPLPASEPPRRSVRPKMALRIPDDEVARPTSNVPPPAAVEGPPIVATPIINIGAPPSEGGDAAPSVPSLPESLAAGSAPSVPSAPISAASRGEGGPTSEDSWTPYQPTVADLEAERLAGRPSRPDLGAPLANHAVARADDSAESIDLVAKGAPRPKPEPKVIPRPGSAPSIRQRGGSTSSMTTDDMRARMPTEPEGEDINFDDEPLPPADYVAQNPDSMHPVPLEDGDVVAVDSTPPKKRSQPPTQLSAAPAHPTSVPTAVAAPVVRQAAPPLPAGRASSPGFNKDAFLPASPAALTATAAVLGATAPLAPSAAAAPPGAVPQSSATQTSAPARSGPPALPPQAAIATSPPSGVHAASAPGGTLLQSSAGQSASPPQGLPSIGDKKKPRPWWEELFNDDFIRTMAKITDAQIRREADFIEESLGVQKGGMLLDLACGTGRHAIEMAARGYHLVGFDLSLAMLARAADEAQERNQKLNFLQGDMREMTFDGTFDGVYSWNTSFGFFDEEKNAQVVARVYKALKKGGQFLLDVVNRDYVGREAPSLAWYEGDGCICMDEMQMDWITSRMRVKRTMMMDDGRTKEIEYSIRLYSLHELGKLLHDHGFRIAEVSGRTATPGVYFGSESPRTLILAEKR